MGRILKYFLIALAAIAAVLVVAAILFVLLFDANDYREDIEKTVKESTGREFSIEGDLNVSLFPWLAIEMGKTTLGNAQGFSDAPFATFNKARLSVQVMPLLLRREITIGTAELDALELNLEVNRNGRGNWQDLADRSDAADAGQPDTGEAPSGAFQFAGLKMTDANLSYRNAQLDERYRLGNLNVTTGSVEPGEPVSIDGGFDFEAQPADTSGRVDMQTVVAFDADEATIRLSDLSIDGSASGETPLDFAFAAPAITLQTEARTADLGEIRISIFDVDIAADFEAFSYADSPTPKAAIRIDAFSPRSLMKALNIEVPETADPGALSNLMIDAKADVSDAAIRLSALELVLDDTTFKGELVVPRSSNGTYRLDLVADSIDVNRYMAPPDESGGQNTSDVPPMEIPAEIIRAVNARGNLEIATAILGPMRFDAVKLGLNVANDQLRMHPISAQFFDGAYEGDIRIDATDSTPVLSVNEQVRDVSLGAFARTMFEREDITGTVRGSFVLSGRGNDMAEVQKTLSGNMSFLLSDGAWEGTDLWYEIRKARALFKQEPAPEPTLPARTRFSEVSATGVVTNGLMKNEDFYAELPFMQVNGRGTVDFPTAAIDYSVSGRVFDKPEFMDGASPEEISDLTKAVIPLRITGTLTEPKIGVDIEALLKERVKEEIRGRLLDELLGGEDEEPAAEGEEEEEQDPEDILKDKLKDIFN